MTHDRIQREKYFHNERFGSNIELRKPVSKYYSSLKSHKYYYFEVIKKYCNGKKLLEYGCGTGNQTLSWINMGAIVTGIDVSSEGIKKAKEKALKDKLEVNYFVMDAEKTSFKNNSFDIVVGTGILHHLNLNNSFSEIARILDKDGHAIFLEPLGYNPFINCFRKLTPSMRTIDEHPLRKDDLTLASEQFDYIEKRYFHLFTILAVPFRNTRMFSFILNFLTSIDNRVMSILPGIRKYAWIVVLDLHKTS